MTVEAPRRGQDGGERRKFLPSADPWPVAAGPAKRPGVTGAGLESTNTGFVKPKSSNHRPTLAQKGGKGEPSAPSSSDSSESEGKGDNRPVRRKTPSSYHAAMERRFQLEDAERARRLADLAKEAKLRRETGRLAREELKTKKELAQLERRARKERESSRSASSRSSKSESSSQQGSPREDPRYHPADAARMQMPEARVYDGTTYYQLPSQTGGATFLQLPIQTGYMDTWFIADQALKALPVFTGKVQDYPNWVQLARKYAQLPGISEETKLTQLKQKLSGRPAEIVRQIDSIDPKAVRCLFEELKNEYGDAKAVYLAQMKRLDELPSPSFKYEDMRSFYLTVQNVLSCLRTLEVEFREPSTMLEKLVMKLPVGWRQSFFEKYARKRVRPRAEGEVEDKIYSGSAKVTVEDLLDFLQFKISHLRLVEQAAAVEGSSKANKKGDSRTTAKSAKGGRTYANLPKENDKEASKFEKAIKDGEKANQKPKYYCHLCEKDGHSISRCRAFKDMSPKERLQFATKKRLHYWCLERHANFRDCKKLEFDDQGNLMSKCPVEGCRGVHHKG